MIRSIISDLDGTLLNGVGEVSERSKKAILQCKEKGIDFVVATGRDETSAFSLFEDGFVDAYILLNGSKMIISNEVIWDCFLSYDTLIFLSNLLHQYHIPCIFFTNKGIVSTNAKKTQAQFEDALYRSGMSQKEIQQMLSSDAFGSYYAEIDDVSQLIQEHYIVYKCEFYAPNEEIYQQICAQIKENDEVSIAGWISLNIECTNKKANKGDALQRYLQIKNLKKEEVLVCGDSMNDASMMRIVPYSVAMKNASEAIQTIATYTLAYSNREDGVAYIMEELLERYGDYNGIKK